jgi:hypothetical protein
MTIQFLIMVIRKTFQRAFVTQTLFNKNCNFYCTLFFTSVECLTVVYFRQLTCTYRDPKIAAKKLQRNVI